MNTTTLDLERTRRAQIWDGLLAEGGPTQVSPSLVRELRIFSGQAGIWVDISKTRIPGWPSGLTVSLLHTGSSYPDHIDKTGMLYHYPTTMRKGLDEMEISATKAASKAKLPVFVITHSEKTMRDVRQAFVIDWDDKSRIFIISFSEHDVATPFPSIEEEDAAPFCLTKARSNKTRQTSVRDGQPAFQFKVLRRYGAKCAVCPIDFSELVDAAHIREHSDQGSDDPRNGIVLCATHHRAFDKKLFVFEPESLKVVLKPGIGLPLAIGITQTSLQHLKLRPHPEAIRWRWEKWQKTKQMPEREDGKSARA